MRRQICGSACNACVRAWVEGWRVDGWNDGWMDGWVCRRWASARWPALALSLSLSLTHTHTHTNPEPQSSVSLSFPHLASPSHTHTLALMFARSRAHSKKSQAKHNTVPAQFSAAQNREQAPTYRHLEQLAMLMAVHPKQPIAACVGCLHLLYSFSSSLANAFPKPDGVESLWICCPGRARPVECVGAPCAGPSARNRRVTTRPSKPHGCGKGSRVTRWTLQ